MPTADEVSVKLDVDTRQYLAALSRADRSFAEFTARLEREAIEAGAAFSRLGERATKAWVQTNADAPKAARAVQGVSGQVSNLGAQFQDIAVQLQSGTSPFTIALQQGTQISAALGQTGGGAAGAVKALGGAFLSLISPVSIATIGIIALGGAAVQAFLNATHFGETAAQAIERYAKGIGDVVKGYKDAQQIVSDFATEASRLSLDAIGTKLGQSLESANTEFEQLQRKAYNTAIIMTDFGSEADKAVKKLLLGFADGSISATDLQDDLIKVGASADKGFGVAAFATQLMIDNFIEAAGKAKALEQALVSIEHVLAQIATSASTQIAIDARITGFDDAVEKLKSLTPELRTQREIVQSTYNDAISGAITQGQKDLATSTRDTALAALDEKDARAAADEANQKSITTSKQLADTKAQEAQAVLDYIDNLNFELSLIGLSNEQRAVEIALRAAGAAATKDQKDEIEAKTRAQIQENAELKRAQELYDQIKGAADNALKGFLHDIAEGKSAGEAFSGLLDDILSKLIDFGVSTALNAIFPGLGTIVNGARAMGGPVASGSSYLVGEKGPEIFTPSSAGSITSNSDMMSAGGGGKVAIYLGPGLTADLLDQSAQQSIQIVQSMTPPMIAQGAGAAAAKSRRDRVA